MVARGEWKRRKPSWWLLYLIAALMVAGVGLADAWVEVGGLRTLLELMTVLAGFALLAVWFRSNRVALDLAKAGRRYRR
jgi:hypothetical protein